ncbi:MAG: hypothetical protein Q8S13_09250 [Dehalococcoidia bacterium]|nr:hypothetical protein [Dehalococcoidia bacterium]
MAEHSTGAGLDFLGYDEMGAALFRRPTALARPSWPTAPQYQPQPQFQRPPLAGWGGGGSGFSQIQSANTQGLANWYQSNCKVRPNAFGQVPGRQFLGFPVTSITANTTADLTRNPQRPMMPKRLIIPSNIAGNAQTASGASGLFTPDKSYAFTVVDLKIGNASQLNASGELPALVFAETATYIEQDMDPAFVGNNVTLSIRNVDGTNAHYFAAALVGDACNMASPWGG